MKRFVTRPLITILCASGMLGLSSQAMATAFQLYQQDGASIANVNAGYAAEANDASTAFYNPAGITRIQNMQAVYGVTEIISDFKYKGDVSVTELAPTLVLTPVPHLGFAPATTTYQGVTSQGGTANTVPSFNFVTPINDWIGFGFSAVAPFGLKTSYGLSTPTRYASTLAEINIMDLTPSVGIKITREASIGLGFDAQRGFGEFDSVGVLTAIPGSDSTSTNRAWDWGYGYHLGALYELSPCLRFGVSYHSQVVHHLVGHSKLEGPIAIETSGVFESPRTTATITLPAYTALSVFNKLTPQWAVMGSAIYTQWTSFKQLTINSVATATPITTLPFFTTTFENATIPAHYRNTWNLSVGADYYFSNDITLRSGIGFDESPLKDEYRNLSLPDNDHYNVGLGAHFQATKTVGIDVGWQHVFFRQDVVNPPPLVIGGQTTTTDGNVFGNADLFSGQIVWDIV